MASKNDARRLKKRAERARERSKVAKSKLDLERLKRKNVTSHRSHTQSLLSDVLEAMTQCNTGLNHMNTLFGFTDILAARKPSYHTEDLNIEFETIGVEAVVSFNTLGEVRDHLKEFANVLKDPIHGMSRLMEIVQYMMVSLPKVEGFATECGKYASSVAELIKKSDALYKEAVKTDETLQPLLSPEERNTLSLYVDLGGIIDPVDGSLANMVQMGDVDDMSYLAESVKTLASENETLMSDSSKVEDTDSESDVHPLVEAMELNMDSDTATVSTM